MAGLTDEELLKKLKDFGEKSPGPITPTTRNVWERRLSTLRRSRRNAFSSDDSEIESPTPRRRRSQVPSPTADVFKKPAVPSPNRTRAKRSRNTSFEVETSDSDLDSSESSLNISHLRRRPLNSSASAISRPEQPVTWNTQTTTNSNLYRLKKDSGVCVSNGYPSSLPNREFVVKEDSKSTNYSHCISWLLLLGTVAFFLTLGALYMQRSNITPSQYSKLCNGVPKDLCKPLLTVSKELHSLLSDIAGKYECGEIQSKNMTFEDAKTALRSVLHEDSTFLMKHFDEVFSLSVSFFQKNEKWGIKCHTGAVNLLEAVKGAKSLLCRIRMSLQWTLGKLILLLGIFLSGCMCYGGVVLWKKRREAQERLFYEMVEKVIDILQEESIGDSYKAVVNIRETLIPAKDRKRHLWLWERVVAFIEENESRVSVEFQTINGEDFKVWRWNPSSSAENENGKQGKVWQGQAFSNQGKGKTNTYSPSPCLKIRNMFDPEVEYGNEWQVSVRDAILEKCEGNNGIIHIAFDATNNNEGCVFMMCNSTEAAGKAYNDLHGWWFDGKLVTVKYLKAARYLQRFPGVDKNTQSLHPSNDRRLSLSTPFFRSVLERS